jgi:hypothetical protein
MRRPSRKNECNWEIPLEKCGELFPYLSKVSRVVGRLRMHRARRINRKRIGGAYDG